MLCARIVFEVCNQREVGGFAAIFERWMCTISRAVRSRTLETWEGLAGRRYRQRLEFLLKQCLRRDERERFAGHAV